MGYNRNILHYARIHEIKGRGERNYRQITVRDLDRLFRRRRRAARCVSDLAIGRDQRYRDIELVDERDMGRERHSSCKVRFNRMNLFGLASVPVCDSGTSPGSRRGQSSLNRGCHQAAWLGGSSHCGLSSLR